MGRGWCGGRGSGYELVCVGCCIAASLESLERGTPLLFKYEKAPTVSNTILLPNVNITALGMFWVRKLQNYFCTRFSP